MAQRKTKRRGCRWPAVDNPHRSRLTRCPSHDWSSTVRVAHQGHRSCGGVGRFWPYKICRKGQSMFDPLKILHSFIQNCCCITASFTTSRMNSWTLSLHWSCLCWRCYHPYVWSSRSRLCPPINVFAAILGFKLSWPKTKLQNMGATIFIDGVQLKE